MMLAGRGEMVDRPDLVGPDSGTEQPVFLRLDVDQVEHISANIVHPGVKIFRNRPVTDGPAGPDGTRRPVGTEWIYAERDADRPTADGPNCSIRTRYALVGCLSLTNFISRWQLALWASRL